MAYTLDHLHGRHWLHTYHRLHHLGEIICSDHFHALFIATGPDGPRRLCALRYTLY